MRKVLNYQRFQEAVAQRATRFGLAGISSQVSRLVNIVANVK